ncbi:5-formyltetrahydrofolate cyclo-ligase [Paenibacillus harenae]|uniref:5-formyltetrahydrofolate cyclo-ligase n=1 Tax=Paenibacillus harenae TaxID=306543 RepID=UPI0003F73A60|nr:5-formyltetrahydrofolate cyclo-ligase [Paenibacillus harenae]
MNALDKLSGRDEKAVFRRQMTQRRDGLPMERRKEWSSAACANAKGLLESRSVQSFMVYISYRSELNLSELIEWGWQSGRAVIVPRCVAADFTMTLHDLRSWDELVPGAYGIMEPNPATTPALDKSYMPEAVFVPGLAFDRNGGRLGYGGGYYDRFAAARLKDAGEAARTLWIGAAFEAQLVEGFPIEAHDLPMDGILTEKDVYMV